MLLDIWVRVSDGSTVVGNDVWDLVLAHGLASDTAELESGLLGVDSVSLESAFNIEEDSEELSSSLNSDYVHHAEWESGVSSDLSVNFDQSLLVLNNLDCLLASDCISQSVSEENVERDAFSSLVGTSGWSGSINSS